MEKQRMQMILNTNGADVAKLIILEGILSEIFDKHNEIQKRIAVAQERIAYAQEKMAISQEEQLELQKKVTAITTNML